MRVLEYAKPSLSVIFDKKDLMLCIRFSYIFIRLSDKGPSILGYTASTQKPVLEIDPQPNFVVFGGLPTPSLVPSHQVRVGLNHYVDS